MRINQLGGDTYYNGSVDRGAFYGEINDYLNKYYENRYELRKQPEVVETKVNHLIAKLQKMYGNVMQIPCK